MKQYIMGMLTGASLILCAVMFIGASSNNSNNGKYQALSDKDGDLYLLKTSTAEVYMADMGIFGIQWVKFSKPILDD